MFGIGRRKYGAILDESVTTGSWRSATVAQKFEPEDQAGGRKLLTVETNLIYTFVFYQAHDRDMAP